MKKVYTAIALLALSCLWLGGSLYAKAKYDVILERDRSVARKVVPFDEQGLDRLAAVRANWKSKEITHTEFAALLVAAGLKPSVQGVAELIRAPMPEYPWWPISECRRAAQKGLAVRIFADAGMPLLLRVSEDEHLAALWCATNLVIVFQDAPGGIRETWYHETR